MCYMTDTDKNNNNSSNNFSNDIAISVISNKCIGCPAKNKKYQKT